MNVLEISSRITPRNKPRFKTLFQTLQQSKFESTVFEFILGRQSENDFFDIDLWRKTYLYNNKEMMTNILDEMYKKLDSTGWKHKTVYKGGGLFIYSTETQPPSCFDDSLE